MAAVGQLKEKEDSDTKLWALDAAGKRWCCVLEWIGKAFSVEFPYLQTMEQPSR